MDELAAYTVVPSLPPWPRGETRITFGELVAVSRSEPWPDVLTRRWPDGVKGLPFLLWLLGHKRRTSQSRIVVRRADGRPVLRLHEPEAIFRRTVGIFDADDVRIGYFAGGFKGASEGFAVWDSAHQLVARLSKSGVTYRLVAADGASLGEIAPATEGYAVAANCDSVKSRLFVLAATLVLIAWGLLPGKQPELGR